ncbi:ankyrin repeat domain-containing protein [Brevibacillus sp. HD1.4A]|uniref:ankyrin repeat domain-containing protein n=1 Tax=Brevibacillus sp. HD1.4A TaxID=2738978 RepID=UPI00156B717B|nr:ankyrin repeat domain-containing protein [Brevibacillus sp. HD1.4A]NRQ55712.1 ankyrin repeat domain-containing protein [Brevibacillus sp. HD1.4A]
MKKNSARILWLIFGLLVMVSGIVAVNVPSSNGPVYNGAYNDDFNPNKFFDAVLSGNIEMVKPFIENSINPNLTDQDGRTALFIAIREQNYTITEYLLAAKANPNIKDFYGDSPLKIAEGYKNKKLIDLLTQYGATE